MTQQITDEMVNRFLTWPVPAHVHPDGTPGKPGRTGTNLLDAHTAREMLEHVFAPACPLPNDPECEACK